MSCNQKLVDYFVISGLNISSGLEPDQLSGYFFNFNDLISSVVDSDNDNVGMIIIFAVENAMFTEGCYKLRSHSLHLITNDIGHSHTLAKRC